MVSNQPNFTGSGPFPPQPGDPAAPNWPSSGPTPKTGPTPKNRKPLLVTVGAAVAVVLVAVAVVVAMVVSSGGEESVDASRPGAGEAAKAYLEALARGDAQAALELGASRPASAELLTDEVLRKQIAEMPITDIQVLDDAEESNDGALAKVRVSARFGEQRSEGDLQMVYRDGAWKLARAFVNVSSTVWPDDDTNPGSALRVFGKKLLRSGHFYVFPGYVEVTTTTPYLQSTQPGTLGLDRLTSGFYMQFEFTMTEEGRRAAEEALLAHLTACFQPGGVRNPECSKFIGPDSLKGYDMNTVALTGPIDLSGVTFDYLSIYRWASARGNISDIPLTARRLDGEPGEITGRLSVNEQIDLGVDPPVLMRSR